MKFNSYIVELKHRDIAVTGSLTTAAGTVSANFKKIGKDTFIANFKNQVEFKFLEKAAFKTRNKEILVLLPVISKYNKRKLTKIAKFLGSPGGREKHNILLHFLTVDKFIKVQDLLYFFSMAREEIIEFLFQKEIEKKVKIIRFDNLSITSYENFQNYLKELNTIFTNHYTGRIKIIDLSEIEAKLKLPQSSLFFKYLLRERTLTDNFLFKVLKDKIVFQKLVLTETEKDSLVEIEHILKKNKTSIFTVENIIKSSHLIYQEVNDSLWFLLDSGRIVQLNEKYFIFKVELDKILNKLKKYKRNQGEIIDIKSFRELTFFSRKYIIALFEYFDSQQVTRRVENQREILLGV